MIQINKTYQYNKNDLQFTFRIFSEGKLSYHIITETFDLYKVSKTEMINNLQNKYIHLYNKETK